MKRRFYPVFIMFSARIKKIVLAVSLFAVLFQMLPLPVMAAQSDAYTYSNTSPDVPRNLHMTSQIVLIETVSAVICQLVGIDPINPAAPCLGIDRTTNTISFVKPQTANGKYQLGGALGMLVGMISMTYDIPIHGGEYTRYIATNFGVVKPALAQTGSGFNSLSPIMNIWIKVRDITYFAFVVVFVLIGFAVMLRVKLDPKTTMSIQNQIPKVIITIVLITLSYALAGALVDAMWVATYTGINLLVSNGDICKNASVSLPHQATMGLMNNPLYYVGGLLQCQDAGVSSKHFAIENLGYNVGMTLGDVVSRTLFSALGLDNIPECHFSLLSSKTWGACIQQGVWNAVAKVVGLIATLAIIIAIFVQLFRVWFALIKSYLYLIFYTILGPIWIFLGLFPNSTYGVGSWMRHMFSVLMVYPVAVFLFLVGTILANSSTATSANPTKYFVPPLIGNPNITNNLGYLLSLAAILVAPEVVKMMEELFKANPPKYGAPIFAAIGMGMKSASRPVTATWGSLTARDNAGNAKGLGSYLSDRFTGGATRKVTDWVTHATENSKSKLVKGFGETVRGSYNARFGNNEALGLGRSESSKEKTAREAAEKAATERNEQANKSSAAIDKLAAAVDKLNQKTEDKPGGGTPPPPPPTQTPPPIIPPAPPAPPSSGTSGGGTGNEPENPPGGNNPTA